MLHTTPDLWLLFAAGFSLLALASWRRIRRGHRRLRLVPKPFASNGAPRMRTGSFPSHSNIPA